MLAMWFLITTPTTKKIASLKLYLLKIASCNSIINRNLKFFVCVVDDFRPKKIDPFFHIQIES